MEFIKINKLFSGSSYFAVPDYQRDYEWTNSQNSTLADDVFALIKTNERHFIGAIVTIPFEEANSTNKSIMLNDYGVDIRNVKHLVDGQQRLTSISIFAKTLHDIIKIDESISEVEKNRQTQRLSRLLTGDDYNQNGIAAPHLILNGNTGVYYNSYILGLGEAHCYRQYKGAKRIQTAYEFYNDAIAEEKNKHLADGTCSDSLDFYEELIKILAEKIELVEIDCPEASNAFQVFDSLNGKGLDLTVADRIKNIVMSWSPAGSGAQKWGAIESEIAEEYLTNFFVSLFFLYEKKRISKNKLPDSFRDRFKTSAQINYEGFFTKLREQASIYGSLRNSRTSSRIINGYLEDLNQLKFDQVYVMLFCALSNYGSNICKKRTFEDYINALTNLVVRMQVCEKGTNKLDVFFGKYIKYMIEDNKSIDYITQRIREDMINTAPDEQFKIDFANFCPDNNTSEYYLRKIENYMRIKKSGNRTGVERKKATVEHIIPQGLEDLKDWYGEEEIPEEIQDDFNKTICECIGNKALLFGDDNSSASDNNYSIKINVYKNGKEGQIEGNPYETFEMIKEVVDEYSVKFNHLEVKERAKKLSEYAVMIWK